MLSFQCNANTPDSTATKEPSKQDGSPEASERSEGKKHAQGHNENQDGHNVFSVKSTNSGPVLFCCLSNINICNANTTEPNNPGASECRGIRTAVSSMDKKQAQTNDL